MAFFSSKLNIFKLTLIFPFIVLGLASCNSGGQMPQPPEPPAPPPQDDVGPVGKVSLERVTTMSDLIVVGAVADIASNDSGTGNVYTLVTINVEQSIKGQAPQRVTVRVPGGVTGGIVMMTTGAPSFKAGERDVVFLQKPEGGIYTVAYGMFGKYVIDGSGTVNNMSLADFINQVKSILATQQK